jgi:hypothetical protein
MTIAIYKHFHSDYPIDSDCDWYIPTYTGNKESIGWSPTNNADKFLNVTDTDKSILELRKYYKDISEDQFLIAMGQQATEYYLMRNTPEVDYIGCGTYRRYLSFTGTMTGSENELQDKVKYLCREEEKNALSDILKQCDIVVNHEENVGNTVEQQYLYGPAWHQDKQIYDLFLEAINKLMPQYRNSVNWFKQSNVANFHTTYVMRRDLFKRYSSELFEIIEYILKHSQNPYPIKTADKPMSDPKPWRWPGYLGERFLPFFINVNPITRAHVAMSFL